LDGLLGPVPNCGLRFGTGALRIEAQLRPRLSAGIVEWRVGP
jgi:hypothetical protein